MKVLSAQATAQRNLDAVKVIYLVEIDADAPSAATATQYYGTRKYVLGSNTYQDGLSVRGGINVGWQRLRVGGGLASVSGARLTLRNEEKESNLVDTYFLDNDEARVYVIFSNDEEDADDRVPLGNYVIENYPYNARQWSFDFIDGSDKDFREFPTEEINLIDFVDAPLDSIGKVLPVPFGVLSSGPHDLSGIFPFLSPAANVDIFTRNYTSGTKNDDYGAVFQYYAGSRRLGEVLATTRRNSAAASDVSGAFFTVDNGTRKLWLHPGYPKDTNDVAGWKGAANRDSTSGVAITTDDDLDLVFSGVDKLGTLNNLYCRFKTTASTAFTYNIFHGVTSLDTATVTSDGSGDVSVDLTSDIATYFTEDWDFEKMSVEISATENTIFAVYLDLRYEDQESTDQESLPLYQKVNGFEDTAAYYADGAVINTNGLVLQIPPEQLEAIFRAKTLLGLTESNIRSASFGTAATARATWKFAFALDQPVKIQWLNTFAFECGCHLFKDTAAQWTLIAQDKTAAPSHYFSPHNIAIKNPTADPSSWESDIRFKRTPVRDLINEIHIQYGYDRATREYTKSKTASARERVSGTCSTVASTGKLTDASATFLADGVSINDIVYVEGDKDYTVTAKDSETVLSITEAVGVNDNAAGTNYWLGPNLRGEMVRSQTRYKTEHVLGEELDKRSGRGGYQSQLIHDDTTVQNLIDHLIDWRSQRRLTVEYSTFLNAVDVELGDMSFFDHAWLPLTKRPVALTTSSQALTDAATTLTVRANIIRVDDYILIGDEIVKCTARTPSLMRITVVRAQCNTIAAAHDSGSTISLMNRIKWEVTGIKADVARAQMRIELQETPPSYYPTGIVSAASYPNYIAANAAQRALSGWATLPSGRIVDDDEYSAISYVGPDAN